MPGFRNARNRPFHRDTSPQAAEPPLPPGSPARPPRRSSNPRGRRRGPAGRRRPAGSVRRRLGGVRMSGGGEWRVRGWAGTQERRQVLRCPGTPWVAGGSWTDSRNLEARSPATSHRPTAWKVPGQSTPPAPATPGPGPAIQRRRPMGPSLGTPAPPRDPRRRRGVQWPSWRCGGGSWRFCLLASSPKARECLSFRLPRAAGKGQVLWRCARRPGTYTNVAGPWVPPGPTERPIWLFPSARTCLPSRRLIGGSDAGRASFAPRRSPQRE